MVRQRRCGGRLRLDSLHPPPAAPIGCLSFSFGCNARKGSNPCARFDVGSLSNGIAARPSTITEESPKTAPPSIQPRLKDQRQSRGLIAAELSRLAPEQVSAS